MPQSPPAPHTARALPVVRRVPATQGLAESATDPNAIDPAPTAIRVHRLDPPALSNPTPGSPLTPARPALHSHGAHAPLSADSWAVLCRSCHSSAYPSTRAVRPYRRSTAYA